MNSQTGIGEGECGAGGLEEEDSLIVQDVTRFSCFIGHQLQVEQTLDHLVAKEFIILPSPLERTRSETQALVSLTIVTMHPCNKGKVMVLRASAHLSEVAHV